MFMGAIIATQQAATSAALLANKKQQEYQRGRHAAQLAEDFDPHKSLDWQQGYKDEIKHPSGGLTPQ